MLKGNPDNIVVFDKTGDDFIEMTFEDFLRFQKNTVLRSSDYLVIKGTIIKHFNEPGEQLLSNLDTYKRS